jgi:cytochrome c-type biogenesis protein CcmH
MIRICAVILLFFTIINSSFSEQIYPFADKKSSAQFQHLLTNLRCPVCQNQDLSDSNAGLAKDLRQEVYRLVNLGKTDDEIINYLTDRYGDFILFKPKLKAVTIFLWLGPLIFIFIGLIVFYLSVKRRPDARI